MARLTIIRVTTRSLAKRAPSARPVIFSVHILDHVGIPARVQTNNHAVIRFQNICVGLQKLGSLISMKVAYGTSPRKSVDLVQPGISQRAVLKGKGNKSSARNGKWEMATGMNQGVTNSPMLEPKWRMHFDLSTMAGCFNHITPSS